jgi:small subunit ribosomal protein S10
MTPLLKRISETQRKQMAFCHSRLSVRLQMPFVTTLTFTSGDRHRLDDVVTEIKQSAEQKGVELKGPHPKQPQELRIPQSKSLGPSGGRFESWTHTVYTRTIEIVGYEEFARTVTQRTFPNAIHVEAGVEQRTQVGSGS